MALNGAVTDQQNALAAKLRGHAFSRKILSQALRFRNVN
jgi:hypothetical protein